MRSGCLRVGEGEGGGCSPLPDDEDEDGIAGVSK
jgi:hypothetical protein